MASTSRLTPTAMHASIVRAPEVALRKRPAARADRATRPDLGSHVGRHLAKIGVVLGQQLQAASDSQLT